MGVQAVEALRKSYEFPEEVRLIDGGTFGLDLLPLIEGMEGILFIDAMDLKKEPGTIAIIEDEEIPSFLAPKLSLHHVGLSDLLFASSFMGNKPPKMALVGIQPEKIDVGLDLSPRDTDRVLKNCCIPYWKNSVNGALGSGKNRIGSHCLCAWPFRLKS